MLLGGVGASRFGSSILQRVERQSLGAMSQVSTGLRMMRASDDPGNVGLSNRMASQERGLAEARKASQEGISMLSVATEGLNPLIQRVQRMRELVISLGNGIRTTEDRDAIKAELNENLLAFDVEAAAVAYNDRKLLNTPGRRSLTINVTVGADRNSKEAVVLDNIDARSTRLDVAMLQNLDRVNGRRNAVRLLDAAEAKLTALRQRYGQAQTGLEAQMGAALGAQQAYGEAGSRLRDADMAFASMQVVRSQLVSKAGMAMQAQGALRVDGVRTLLGALQQED